MGAHRLKCNTIQNFINMFGLQRLPSLTVRSNNLRTISRFSSSVAYPQHAPKTKIVCTMGPSSEPRLEELVQAGIDMNLFLNPNL